MAEDKKYTKAELLKKLTPKEKKFCHEYIIDWNGSRAAKEAGYSEKTRAVIASENLTKPYITQYIDFIKHDYEKESGISKLRQLNELAKIAYSNISHLHDNWVELTDWEEIKENNPNCLAAVETIDTKTETRTHRTDGDDESETEVEYVKLKLHSKPSAIAEINKIMGYHAAEKKDHTSSDGSMTPITGITFDE
ncbi:MAG: terminase small subunit [Candidatus Neomarinimicrobiota bacterium]